MKQILSVFMKRLAIALGLAALMIGSLLLARGEGQLIGALFLGYFAALEKMGLPPEKALVIGDQVFIDILGANRSGIRSVLVHYIEAPGERWIGFRRYAEKAILLVWRLRKRLRSITYHKKEN